MLNCIRVGIYYPWTDDNCGEIDRETKATVVHMPIIVYARFFKNK